MSEVYKCISDQMTMMWCWVGGEWGSFFLSHTTFYIGETKYDMITQTILEKSALPNLCAVVNANLVN